MEKIELNKRTLRTLSMSELTMIGGASEDGDEDPGQAAINAANAAGKTKPTPPYSSECPSAKCPITSEICPPTNDRKCCPNTGT